MRKAYSLLFIFKVLDEQQFVIVGKEECNPHEVATLSFWFLCKEVVFLHCRLMSWDRFESILKPAVLVTPPIICSRER